MNFVKKTIIPFFVLFFCLLNFSVTQVNAGSLLDQQVGFSSEQGDGIGKAFNEQASKPTEDIRIVIAKIIKVFLGFMGIVFVVLIIIAGFKYMNSQGNESTVEEAKKTISRAIIGLAIIMISYAITAYITDCIYDITTGNTIWMCK
jgi:cytochrome bd-type quinol oxidase subunit 2